MTNAIAIAIVEEELDGTALLQALRSLPFPEARSAPECEETGPPVGEALESQSAAQGRSQLGLRKRFGKEPKALGQLAQVKVLFRVTAG